MTEQHYGVAITDDELTKFTDDKLALVGQLLADAMRRRRGSVLCEREGHIELTHGVCLRCQTVVEWPT